MSVAGIAEKEERVRTTVTLPVELRQRLKRAVQRGTASSQNSLIVHAVDTYLARQEEAWIDAQFAQMAEDMEYQDLQRQIAAEFSVSDGEALQANEESL